jgi:hypothetical protein
MRRLVLVGRGELTEIALLAGWDEGMEFEGVVDPQANKDRICGLRVIRSPLEIGAVDAAVITESRRPQQAYEELRRHLPEAQVLAPALLKITRGLRPDATGEPGEWSR